MSGDNQAPIIIKRKKVVSGDGHHGGAWKVAYADFVTAMMAFFLLMWLIGATNENQRKGLADYFNPTIPINRVSGGGEGAFGGDSVFSESSLAQNGTGAALLRPTEERQARGDTGVDASDDAQSEDEARRAEAAALAEVAEALKGAGGESVVTELLNRHIVSRLTDEGLIVELFDLPGDPLFEPGTARPTPLLEDLATAVAEVFEITLNEVAVQAHLAARPVVLAENPIWDLSTARAGQARALLEEAGLETRRLQRVTGFADRRPAVRAPMSVRNNRVEIILLRSRL